MSSNLILLGRPTKRQKTQQAENVSYEVELNKKTKIDLQTECKQKNLAAGTSSIDLSLIAKVVLNPSLLPD